MLSNLSKKAKVFSHLLKHRPGKIIKRNLNVHEHVSMKILSDNGVNVPRFGVAKTPEEVAGIIKSLKCVNYVVKAQVLTGGRGKGHFDNGLKGVKMATSDQEAIQFATQMLGHKLITVQTGEKGIICNEVMIVERLDPLKEFYFAIMLDPGHQGPVILASKEGGMDIEKIAVERPESIITESINIETGVTREQASRVAEKLGFSGKSIDEARDMIMRMYETFLKEDCLMLEINPFVEEKKGKPLCLDAKVRIDDNAQFRHKQIFESRDWSQSDIREREATNSNLNYISLDGDIGCLVNGAGLAMATMDLIKLHGGNPANFLDVGGGATAPQVTEALRIISSDPKVKVIFVNIFGGIMSCEVIAKGIIQAVKTLDLKMPIICRLQGTAFEDAQALIRASNLGNILAHDEFDASARLSAKVAKSDDDFHLELPL